MTRRFVSDRVNYSNFTRKGLIHSLGLIVLFAATLCFAAKNGPAPNTCSTGTLAPGSGEDLIVSTGICKVKPSLTPYNYGKVNIYGGGQLLFDFDKTNLDGVQPGEWHANGY